MLNVITPAADADVARPIDTLVLVPASKKTVTLPTAIANAGLQVTVKNTSAGGPTTVACMAGQMIDCVPTLLLKAPYMFCTCVSDGAAWWVTARG